MPASQKEIPVDGLVRSYELTDVKSWKRLKVTVRGTDTLLNVDHMSTTLDTHETVPTGKVTNIRALSTQPTSAQLTWDPPLCEHRGGRLKNYLVQVAPVRDPNKISVLLPTTESQMANDLEPYTEYKVVVRYVNYRGQGPDSDPLFFNTSQGPPSAPMIYNFTFDDSSIGLVIIQPLQPRGQIDQYHLQVRAHNAAGWGEWSRLISVTTKDEFRPVAKAIIQDLANASCIGFHWLAPADQTNVINSYTIRVEKVGDVQASHESVVPKSTLSFIQCGLRPYSEYEVTVRIFKDNGQSGQALAARMWTEGLVPPKPRQPNVRKTTSNTVTVEIYPVTFRDGPLSTYEIRVLELQHNHTSQQPHIFDPSKEPMLQDLSPRPSSYTEADKIDKPTLKTVTALPSPTAATPRPQQEDNGPYFRAVRKRSTRPKSNLKLVIIPAPSSLASHSANISTWFESWRLKWLYDSQIRCWRPQTADCTKPVSPNRGRATPIQLIGSSLPIMNASISPQHHQQVRLARFIQGCFTSHRRKSGTETNLKTAGHVRSLRRKRQTSGLPGALWMEFPANSLTEPRYITVGDDSVNNGKPNIPLKPETEYVIVHVVKSTVVDVTKHAYSYASSTAFTEKLEPPPEEMKEEDDDHLWYWLIILACVILVVLLCLLCFFLISYCMGRRDESATKSKPTSELEDNGSEEDNTDEDSVDYDQRPLKGIDEDGAPSPMRHTDDLESYFNPVHSLGQPRYINTMRDNVMYSGNNETPYSGRNQSNGHLHMVSNGDANNDNNSAILATGATSNMTSNNNLLLESLPGWPNSGADDNRCLDGTSSKVDAGLAQSSPCSVDRIQTEARWTESGVPGVSFGSLVQDISRSIACDLTSNRKLSSSHNRDFISEIDALIGPGEANELIHYGSYDNDDDDEDKGGDKLDTPLSEQLSSSDSLKWISEHFEDRPNTSPPSDRPNTSLPSDRSNTSLPSDRSNTSLPSDSFCSVTVTSLSQRSHLSSSRSSADPSLQLSRGSPDSRSASSTESLDCVLSSSLVSTPRDSSTPKSVSGDDFGIADKIPVTYHRYLNRNNHNVSDDEDTNEFTWEMFLPGSSRNVIVVEKDELGRPKLHIKLRKSTPTKSLTCDIVSAAVVRRIKTDLHPTISWNPQSTNIEVISSSLIRGHMKNPKVDPLNVYFLNKLKASRLRNEDTCYVTRQSSGAIETSSGRRCKRAEISSKLFLCGNVKPRIASGREYVYELRNADYLSFNKYISKLYSLDRYFCSGYAESLFRKKEYEPVSLFRGEYQSDRLMRQEWRLEAHKGKAPAFNLTVNKNIDVVSRPDVEEPTGLNDFSQWHDRGGNVNNNSSWDLEDMDLDTDIETLNSTSSNSTIRQLRRPAELFAASSDQLAGTPSHKPTAMSMDKLAGTPSHKPAAMSMDKLAGTPSHKPTATSMDKLAGTPSHKPTATPSSKLAVASARQSPVTCSVNFGSGPLLYHASDRNYNLPSDSSSSGELDPKGNRPSQCLDNVKGKAEIKVVEDSGLLQQAGSFDSSTKKSTSSAWVDSVYSLQDEVSTTDAGRQNLPTTKKSVTFKLRSQSEAAIFNTNNPGRGESASAGQSEHCPARTDQHFQDDDDLETTLLDVDVSKKGSAIKETTKKKMVTEKLLCQSQPPQHTLSHLGAFEPKIDQCILKSPDHEDYIPDKTLQQIIDGSAVADKSFLSSAASDELSYEDHSSKRRTKTSTVRHCPQPRQTSHKHADSSPDPRDTSNQEILQPITASLPGKSIVQAIPSFSFAMQTERNTRTSSRGKTTRRLNQTQVAPIPGKNFRSLSNDKIQLRRGETPQSRDLRDQSYDRRQQQDVPVAEPLVSNLCTDSLNLRADFANPNFTSGSDKYENSPSDSTSEDKNSPRKTSAKVARLLQMVGFIGGQKHKFGKLDNTKNKSGNKGEIFQLRRSRNIGTDTTGESAEIGGSTNTSQIDTHVNKEAVMATAEDYSDQAARPEMKRSSAKCRSILRKKCWAIFRKHPSIQMKKEKGGNINLLEEIESENEFIRSCKSREENHIHSINEDGDRYSGHKRARSRNKECLETLKSRDKEYLTNMNQSKHDPETNMCDERQTTLEEAKPKKGIKRRMKFFKFSREDNLNMNKASKKKTGRTKTRSTHQGEATRGAPAARPREGPSKRAGTSYRGKHPKKTHKRRPARHYHKSSGPASSVKAVTFKDEFRALEKYKWKLIGSLSFEAAFRHPQLNRFSEELPPDHSRVNVEMSAPGDSDYYNASYLDLGSDIEYIAAQSPFSAFTVSDFWRMVLQNDVETIVMMTNCVEWGQVKCVQYWADHGVFADGPVLVETVEQQVYADFIARTLKVSSSSSPDVQVTHFQFQSWPARGVPDDPVPLLELRYRVRRSHGGKTSPVLVHCETGSRQTAVFIAVDQLIEQYGRHGSVNVYAFVRKMRRSRPEMVRSLKQYRFIYECLFEEFQAGNTSLGLDLERKLKAKSNKNPQTGFSYLMDEFRMLCTFSPAIHPSACAAGLLRENSTKNVDRNIVPPDFYRPFVHIPGNPMTHGYINAVFVDGLRQAREFLVTQIPLSQTVFMFWRMVYDHQVQTIVMLGSVDRPNQSKYIPQTGSRKFEYLLVELINVSSQGPVTVRNLKLWAHTTAGVEKTAIRHFEVAGWVESDRTWNSTEAKTSLSPADVLDLLDLVKEWQTVANRQTRPIVVCCSNGATSCGLFCACAVLCERLREDKEVDLYHTVKHMKRRRPQFISDFGQYRFLHLLLLEEIRTYEDTDEQTALDGGEDTLSLDDEMDSQIVHFKHGAPSALKPIKDLRFSQSRETQDDTYTSQQRGYLEDGGRARCADCITLTTGDSSCGGTCQCVCECDCVESQQDRLYRPSRHMTLRTEMSTPCHRQEPHETPRGTSWNLQHTYCRSEQDELDERNDEEELKDHQRYQSSSKQPARRPHWQDSIEDRRPVTPCPRHQRQKQASTFASRQSAEEISAGSNQMYAARENCFRHRLEESPHRRHGNPSWQENCLNQGYERRVCQDDRLTQLHGNTSRQDVSNWRQQQTSWGDECKNVHQDESMLQKNCDNRYKDESNLLEYCKNRRQENPGLHEDSEIRSKDRANWREDCKHLLLNKPKLPDNSSILRDRRDLLKEYESCRQENPDRLEDCEKRRQVKSNWQEDCQRGPQDSSVRRHAVDSSLQDCLNKCQDRLKHSKDRPIEVSNRVPERRIGRLHTSDQSQDNQRELQESQNRLEDENHQPGPSSLRNVDCYSERDNVTRIKPSKVKANDFDDSSCSEFDVSLNLL